MSHSTIDQVKRSNRPRLSEFVTPVLRIAGTVAVALLVVQSLYAQSTDTATIRGQVVDTTGAVIADTTIVLVNELTGLRREAHTDSNGFYSIAGIPLTGKYVLTVSKAGFAGNRQNNISLTA